MTIELRPLGVHCNLQCQYCYQHPERDAGNVQARFDLDAMKAAVEREGGPFVLFGGEPLLIPPADLETLWSWGLRKFGSNGIQTNGALITDDHIRLFKKYNVGVGISIDGPGELNDARWQGTLERTREATRATERAIQRLCQENMPPGLIVTLHRGNATAALLPRLHDWLRSLERLGVYSVRLHLLEIESPAVRRKYALTEAENRDALIGLKQLQSELRSLYFDVFRDMRRMLLGRDQNASCVWNACDPYTTRAVRGIDGAGQSSNCGRTNKDGIGFVKATAPGFERYLALHGTPQSAGGCHGCRFFMMCKGQCPGTAIDGDWRNRTEHCEVWMSLYETLEDELVAEGLRPLSLHPEREAYERIMLKAWAGGRDAAMSDLVPASDGQAKPWHASFRELRQDLRELWKDAHSLALS